MRVKRWRKPIYVIRDFNNHRKQPDLAEAVTVIRVLAFVIRSSEATTTMVLQRELKTASESPKQMCFISVPYSDNQRYYNKHLQLDAPLKTISLLLQLVSQNQLLQLRESFIMMVPPPKILCHLSNLLVNEAINAN
ncbi:hypothetical protein L1887_18095 [Cichorium endivia]|nr:hypothetical protein L1887_18095 [Cichorium endivia]